MVNVFNSIRATPLRRAGWRQGRGTVLRNDHAIQMKVRRGFEPDSEVSHGEERRNRVGGRTTGADRKLTFPLCSRQKDQHGEVEGGEVA